MDYNAVRDIELRKDDRKQAIQRASKTNPAKIASMGGLTYHFKFGRDFAWVFLFNVREGLHIAYDPERINLMGEGTPVRVMRSPDSSREFRWQVVGIDDSFAQPGTETPTSNFAIGNHAENHQYIDESNIGSDVVFTFQPMLMPLKTSFIAGSLAVDVSPYEYEYQGTHKSFPGLHVFMTAYVPSTGDTRKVLIYLNLETNALEIVSGSSVTLPAVPPDPEIPATIHGQISSRVTLIGDQTNVVQSNIEDARKLFETHFIRTGEIFLTAAGGWPSTTSGSAIPVQNEYTTNDVDLFSMDFDQSTNEYGQWTVWMPDNWDGGTVSFKAAWTAASGSGNVEWNLQGRAYADDDAIDQAWGTQQNVIDTLLAVDDMHISLESPAITLAGSPAGGQVVQFRIYRNAATASDLNADAQLFGIKVYYTKV